MAGTKTGGLKAAQTNKERYGTDFYRKIGADGGKKSRGGGFAGDAELAALAGRLGGLKSRRGEYRLSEKERQALDSDAIRQAQRDIKQYRG